MVISFEFGVVVHFVSFTAVLLVNHQISGQFRPPNLFFNNLAAQQQQPCNRYNAWSDYSICSCGSLTKYRTRLWNSIFPLPSNCKRIMVDKIPCPESECSCLNTRQDCISAPTRAGDNWCDKKDQTNWPPWLQEFCAKDCGFCFKDGSAQPRPDPSSGSFKPPSPDPVVVSTEAPIQSTTTFYDTTAMITTTTTTDDPAATTTEEPEALGGSGGSTDDDNDKDDWNPATDCKCEEWMEWSQCVGGECGSCGKQVRQRKCNNMKKCWTKREETCGSRTKCNKTQMKLFKSRYPKTFRDLKDVGCCKNPTRFGRTCEPWSNRPRQQGPPPMIEPMTDPNRGKGGGRRRRPKQQDE